MILNITFQEIEKRLDIEFKEIHELENRKRDQTKIVTPTEETQVLEADTNKLLSKVIVDPIPSEYVVPQGTLEITDTEVKDVTNTKYVQVVEENLKPQNIVGGISILGVVGSSVNKLKAYLDMTKTLEDAFKVQNLTYEMIDSILAYDDTENVTNMYYAFGWSMTSETGDLDTIPLLNTSNVTNAQGMFASRKIKYLPNFDFSKVTNTSRMFYECKYVEDSSNLKFPANLTNISQMFYGCWKLKKGPSELNISNVTSINNLFNGCKVLEETPILNVVKCTGANSLNSAFTSCFAIKNIRMINIVTSAWVGSGTSYGHLLTLECLINLCQECINVGTSKTLTVGSANLTKLENVYVKLTGEAEEDETLPKLPMVQCESTDEGAMLISSYMNEKGWTLA